MSIKQQAIHGMKWTTVSIIVTTVTQLVTMAVLVRFLAKADFGVMAITLVVRGFADIFMDFGITVAIIHKQNISEKEYSSLYWVNMLIGFILYFLILLITPFIRDFYQQSLLIYLIPLTCLAIPLSSIGRQQKTLLQKELHFKSLAIVEIVSSIVYLLLGVLMAMKGYGVYSLVFPLLLKQLISNILCFIIGSKLAKIRFHFSFKETTPFFKIGLYNTAGQVINYFSCNIDVLVIGKLLGADSLGVYNLAKDLVAKPSAFLSPILSKVITPIFAKLQSQYEELATVFQKVQLINSFFNGFVFILLALLAVPVVSIYYGHGYEKCIPLVILLSLYSFFRQFGSPIGMLAIAKGRTDIDMWWNVFVFFITPLIVYIGSIFSLTAVAFALLFSTILLMIPSYYMYAKPIIHLSFKEYYKPLKEVLKMLIIPSIFLLIYYFFDSEIPHLFNLAFGGTIFALILFIVVKKLFPDMYLELKSLVNNLK